MEMKVDEAAQCGSGDLVDNGRRYDTKRKDEMGGPNSH
ncbi:unnamed protein product [Nippostrongylus brasiliensis]|uniref:Uncharacterized protein n=1 Tax=Nippostrongylus brasiliensis TaxID=27835 RepID=A0A0N4YML9_NIPBR|nr:unnamed protein product [Nippostrongylus brasiliensis]